MANKKDPIDVVRDAADNERLGMKVTDAVDELDADHAREMADAWDTYATALETAAEALSAVDDAEDRDSKTDARESAFAALLELAEAHEHLDGLVDSDA